jgi:YHS domain-containing protein
MEALVYFALWGAFIFLIMRFGCGTHMMGRKRHQASTSTPVDAPSTKADLRWIPPPKDTDPVCGTTVSTDRAKPSVHDGYVYYFCSRECREVFEAAPDVYVGGGKAPATRDLEPSHV